MRISLNPKQASSIESQPIRAGKHIALNIALGFGSRIGWIASQHEVIPIEGGGIKGTLTPVEYPLNGTGPYMGGEFIVGALVTGAFIAPNGLAEYCPD